MALANVFNFVNKWEDQKDIKHFKDKLIEVLELEAPEVQRAAVVVKPVVEEEE
jgi:hypothetical protein